METRTRIFDFVTQMGFDVAVLKNTTQEDIDKFMDDVQRFIDKNPRFTVVGHGRNSIDYDMDEVEKIYGSGEILSDEELEKLKPIYDEVTRYFEEPRISWYVFNISIVGVDEDSIYLSVTHGKESDVESIKEDAHVSVDRETFQIIY